MTADDARRILEESFAHPTPTPSRRLDRGAYIEEHKTALRRLLIDPVLVTAVAGDWPQRYVAGTKNEPRPFYAIARNDTTWLLYDPTTKVFTKASNASESSGSLELIGFESTDALAEWLG